MKIQSVGVIGAGTMGIGVAQNLAQTGHQVTLIDISEQILERAQVEIRHGLRLQNFFATRAGNTTEILARINFSTDYQLLDQAEFVVENATEKWDIKQNIYHQIDRICPPKTIFAANTSAISITRFAGNTNRPDKVIGMHFMNPVPIKPMVELIRGYHTSDTTIETAQEFLTQMGKDSIVVNDAPGFVTNRVMMLTINEAIFILQEGTASVSEIDRLFKGCFGHKMGPLETADLIGLDTILYSIEVLYDSFNDGKYRPCPLLKKMVDAGLHGRKNGRGFYNYSQTAKVKQTVKVA
ncbi:3-hydroxybutyryl-CoA dehydrogenase [Hyella patelloides LEGE 07179]|uniref:3-hydroxybutyryl-CoA dehydrogenase n=1 Tax=Hyella patelloides LEGE 07179 TaxID=945734 RepID=A0A563W1H0_9CYAN|nr:3-hydroxyacyl-CoA dehydrogenase NAD-binding domain-containing protein [Hyella patelloides]VEP17554.1 3-hydroxybutyryl-CoA dehydrogenase [Hyella patelloides LEGE 07179]